MLKRIFNKLLRMSGLSLNRLIPDPTCAADVRRIGHDAAKMEIVKVHFGCGPRILKGWVNIDISYAPFEPYLQYYTDKHYPPAIRGTRNDLYIIDILKHGLPLPDESADLVFHEDFFEHLTQKEQVVFLAETLRVMKKGAVHRINTPNLLASMRDGSDFSKGRNGVHVGEWDNWHHYNVVSPAILADMAQMVGYSRVTFNSKNHSIAAKWLPAEYRPDEKDRPAADSNVFADLIK